MGSFSSHKVQPGKKANNNTILKHRHLRRIANLLRFVEFCVVLVLVSRMSTQLPIAVKNSSEYLHGFSVFMASPCFVFLLGNVIIVTLIVQSGQFLAQGAASKNLESDLYQEFLQNSMINYKNPRIEAEKTEHPKQQKQQQSMLKAEDINKQLQIQKDGCDRVRYPDKFSVRKESFIKGRKIDGCLIKDREQQSTKPATKTVDRVKDHQKIMDGEKVTKTNINLEAKDYKRCQSEIVRNVQREKLGRELHRSESEKNRGSNELVAKRASSSSYPEDGMSNDEFRRTIEAFIARQQRLRKHELCFTA